MSFVRAFVGRTSNQVQHIIESEIPFKGPGGVIRVVNEKGEPVGEELESRDLGWMEPLEKCQTLDGSPCTVARHVFVRIENRPAPSRAELTAGGDLPRFHDCPCSIEGIKDRLRAKGPAAIPMKARAWLANVLPPDEVAAMGIGRGLPIAAMKAVEALRIKRDPESGSRMFVLERKAQQQADAHARARLKARYSGAKNLPRKAAG